MRSELTGFRRVATAFATASMTVLAATALSLFVAPAMPAAAAGSSVVIFSLGTSPAVTLLPSGVTPTAVAQGSADGFAIGSDGNLYAWGENAEGSLGDGSNNFSSTPVQVDLPSGVSPVAVAGGTDDGYAIGSDGNLYAWGWNGQGELGDGTTIGPDLCGSSGTDECSWTPVKVDLPSGVTPTAIATTGIPQPGTAFAIGSDGNLYAWGDNTGDQLGDGSTSGSDVPVKVALPSGVTPTAIAAGSVTAYAIGSDGNLYAWGSGGFGQLGNGTEGSETTTPVEVSLPSGVSPVAIAGALGGTEEGEGYMIGSDGKVYAWGPNADGELGDGTTTGPEQCSVTTPFGTVSSPCSTTPIPVSLPSGVTPSALAGNYNGAAVIGSDGNVYDWGYRISDSPVVVPLPSGTVPEQLGQGSLGTSYAIVNTPNVAPTVTTQPTSQTVYGGTNVSFSAAASGIPAPTVQWQSSSDGGMSWSNISGATSTTYSITDVPTSDNNDEFQAVFTNAAGTATTDAATLTVLPPGAPIVTTQPVGQSVYPTQSVTFTAAASGTPAPTVQWDVSTNGGFTFSPISGATSDTLTVTDVTSSENGYEYEALFTNGGGSATTDSATLTVLTPVAPVVTTQPTDQTDTPGEIGSFTAAASGTPAPTVQWQVSENRGSTWTNIQGISTSTSDTLSGYIFGTFENGWEVQAVFTNVAGSATSNAATLTVTAPVAPVVTTQPTDQTDTPGEVGSFTAAASGLPPPTVVWQYSTDGGSTWSDIAGNATSMSDTLSAVVFGTFENGWEVRAVFTNEAGSATSNSATLTVP